MYISGAVLLVTIVAFITVIIVYNNKVKSQSRVSMLNANKITELVPSISTQNDTTSASTSIGKTINEVNEKNITKNNVTLNTTTIQILILTLTPILILVQKTIK